ncbi:hypothetical protein REC12_20500 [Desulfosporosinus sp. PR]|uniref:hypothetical protein n=1 Tax=Candidatus Desulfosporosinus nitrosoreducens TaxID=3401928 RepID=UPI0027FFC055|nr:hypothetical protein [Desulfosporosinus sp. PR]MDQ7095979.1 hypothetical protein [Desulfosporosinus sp. PR]
MLKKILESTLGSLTSSELKEILDLATADIKVNRVDFGKWTSLKQAINIAASCHSALKRGRVA